MVKENDHRRKIIISGYYGFGNCGDEAILLAMIQQFSDIVPKEDIIVLSNDPDKTRLQYGVSSIFRLNPFHIYVQMKKSAIFVSGGGGLLQDVSGRGFSIIYYSSLIILAQLLKIPSIVFGQGIGPVKSRINKNLIKLAMVKSNLIIVRDKQSQLLLEEIGVRDRSIFVYPDSSFLLKTEEISEDILKKNELKPRTGELNNNINIGIVIRNCKEIEKNYMQKVEQIAGVADHLIVKHKANLSFLPFQIENDLPLINDIVEKMNHSPVEYFDREIGPDQMIPLISEFSIIIGMRLHSIIFATITNKPFIALDYDPKVKNYVNSLGLPELLLNIEQLTIKNIDNKLKYIYDNQEKIIQILHCATKEYRDNVKMGFEKLKNILRKNV